MSTPNYEIGPPDRDLYFRAGSAGLKLSASTGALTSVGGAGFGAWTMVPFNAANFTANGAMTWTVESGDIGNVSYTRIGDVVFMQVWLNTTSVGGTPNTTLSMAFPAGLASQAGNGSFSGSYHYQDNGTYGTGLWTVLSSVAAVNFFKQDLSSWQAATNTTTIHAMVIFRVI